MAQNNLDVFNHEQYMLDATTSVLSNLMRVAKKRNDHIWTAPTYNLQSCLIETDRGLPNTLKETNTKDVLDEEKPTRRIPGSEMITIINSENENYNFGDRRHQIDQERNYSPEFPITMRNPNFGVRRTIRHGRNYSPHVLSTMGLKFVSCGIPKKSATHKAKKAVKEESHKKVGDQIYRERRNHFENGKTTQDQMHRRKGELKFEINEIKSNQTQTLQHVGERNAEYEFVKSEDIGNGYEKANDTRNKFIEWCNQREINYKNSLMKLEINLPPINPPIPPPIPPPINSSTSIKSPDDTKAETFNINSTDAITLSVPMQTESCSLKRVRHASAANSSKLKEKVTTANVKKRPSNKDNEIDLYKNSAETMLSISVNVKGRKFCEITTELRDFQSFRKTLSKFAAAVPNVDCEEKELSYSAEAVKTVLGFLFRPSYNVSNIQNETTAVEILALTHDWEIVKFQKIIQNHFLQNILKQANANKIYSLADHFNLNEMKEACLKLSKDVDFTKYREKKCSISVSTYRDPLDFCIPLHPAVESLTESFDRNILNEIIFESISGNYSIKGIQIRLNVQETEKKDKLATIKIFYSAENVTESLEIPEQKTEKPLGSTIIIYFNNNLVIKPRQKGKISIYMDIKPCLCYTFEEDVIKDPDGNFSLALKSNYTVDKKKSFLIGKLFYHLKKEH